MGNEAIEGSKMGSQLIMFVAIVGLALVAFLVGKNLMNNGLEQMENTVQSVNDSRFSDYNGKTVRGRAVKSAIDTFANDNVAVLVHTLSMTDADATEILSQHAGWGVGVSGSISSGVHANENPTDDVQASNVWKISGLAVDTNDPADPTEDTDIPFVNYGAMLGTNGEISFEGKVMFSRDFALSSSGNVLCNADASKLTVQGSQEYIADSASFNAQLIKNTAGETIGIIFYQKKTY